MTTDFNFSVEQIVEHYARWQIYAGFRESKQEIGSAYAQILSPGVVNQLHFCMVPIVITWNYVLISHWRSAGSIRRTYYRICPCRCGTRPRQPRLWH
jgi:hypothetical protein